MSAEDVSVRDALLLDGVLQRAGDVFLPDDVGKLLRTILAVGVPPLADALVTPL